MYLVPYLLPLNVRVLGQNLSCFLQDLRMEFPLFVSQNQLSTEHGLDVQHRRGGSYPLMNSSCRGLESRGDLLLDRK